MDPTTKDQLHLLSIFHYVLAALAALFSLFPVIHIAVGVAMVSGALDGKNGGAPPPAAFGWIFVVLGVLFMLMGASYAVLVALAGRFLARMRNWTFCVVIAAVSCAFFPFGTVLGVFTIIVLSQQEVKTAFQAARGSSPSAARPA